MKTLIVNTNRHMHPFAVMPLGACMVAEAVERSGHEAALLDLMFVPDPIDAIRRELVRRPVDIVGLSIRNIDNNDMRAPVFFLEQLPDLVKTIREHSDAIVVIGGAAIGVMAEEILRYAGADYAVTGDGENAFPEFLNRIAHGSVADTPGVAHIVDDQFICSAHVPSASCLCSIPDFARWLDIDAYLSRMSTIPVQTKLGCRFKCIYCTYRKIEGEEYRLCTPECVVDGVLKLCSQGFRDIEFVDNVFNAPYDHAMEICRLLHQSRHTARLQSLELNPLFVDDALMGAMQNAGFIGVGVTAESASDPVLQQLRKAFTARDVINAASVIRRHEVPCVWIFLLGGPGESRQTVEETFAFAERFIRPKDAIFFNIGVRVYPGTELETIARQQGVLSVSGNAMLRPTFYLSPELDADWLSERAAAFMKTHMNVIDSTSLSLPFLPDLHKIAHRLGMKPPLWRYTPTIRRLLKYTGVYT